MISVVIPLYNKEDFISKTLGSVLDQTFPDFEVVVVDDGSTDGSKSVVESISDPRIRVLSISNSGVSVARNTGIKVARYPWVAFLDADDWWAPRFLDEMAGAIKEYPKHKLFASGRSRVFQNESERYHNPFLPNDGSTGVLNYFQVISKYLPPVNSSNVVIQAELFEKQGFFKEGMKKHEDHDLWMRLASKEPIVFVNKPLSFYRKTASDTASASVFSATDFDSYLSTMISVRKQITTRDGAFFKKYYNRYVVLAYAQNYGRYTKDERRNAMASIKRLLEGRSRFYARMIHILPLQWLYPTYQKLKK